MLDVNINSINIENNHQSTLLLKNIKFNLENNSVFTIIGENGAGKTTLIKSLTNLLDKRFYTVIGKAIFRGNDLLSLDDETLLELRRERIRYVFQDAVNCFDPLKSLNYYFDKVDTTEEHLKELLHYFLLPELVKVSKLFPYELSGGMAQRLNLVLALAANPELIILDEPTSAIDIPIANITAKKIKEFARKSTSSVLVITQDLNFAFQVSDNIAYLGNQTLSQFQPLSKFEMSGGDLNFDSIKTKFDRLQN